MRPNANLFANALRARQHYTARFGSDRDSRALAITIDQSRHFGRKIHHCPVFGGGLDILFDGVCVPNRVDPATHLMHCYLQRLSFHFCKAAPAIYQASLTTRRN
jgi:hypothetical protein